MSLAAFFFFLFATSGEASSSSNASCSIVEPVDRLRGAFLDFFGDSFNPDPTDSENTRIKIKCKLRT